MDHSGLALSLIFVMSTSDGGYDVIGEGKKEKMNFTLEAGAKLWIRASEKNAFEFG